MAVVALGAFVGVGFGSSRVAVPWRAANTEADFAFHILRSRGLRVSVRFVGAKTGSVSSLEGLPVVRMSPKSGTLVNVGAVVTLYTGYEPGGRPVTFPSHPHYRVPNFIGKAANVPLRWADNHRMFWAIPELPAIRASRAKGLFGAYRVVAQRPKPGRILRQGRITSNGGFRPTPLTLKVKPG